MTNTFLPTQPIPYTVTNKKGLNVRYQTDTTNDRNIARHMSLNEGFLVYEIRTIKGMTGLQTWGRISNNAGEKQSEYCLLEIGNTIYAQISQPPPPPSPAPLPTPNIIEWAWEVDTHLRHATSYTGPHPG